jgi:hypothetical protein
MEITLQFIINIFLSVCGALVYLVINNFKSRINTIDSRIDRIEVDFIPRKEIASEIQALQKIMENNFANLNKDIRRLEDSLNSRINLSEKLFINKQNKS